MRVPERLEPLLEHGVIQDVLRPLMSGKEAEVFLVVADGFECVAKVYKNSSFRSFQNRAEYTEGRRVRSSRQQRAMKKGSRHGREKTEEAWQSAEVNAMGRLRSAGVRVPEPLAFSDGVLVMELVCGEDGEPAPRLVDMQFTPDEARELFHILLREVVKMLCAGVVHADLSDFNILLAVDGPVIIDFPQAIDPANNRNARKMLIRDVDNITSFLGRHAPELRKTKYGLEMWDLYERSELFPDTELTGKFQGSKKKAEVDSLLEDILELEKLARERREALGLPPSKRARRPVTKEKPAEPVRPPRPSRGPKPEPQGDRPAEGSGPKKRPRRRRGSGPRPDGDAPNQGGPRRDDGAAKSERSARSDGAPKTETTTRSGRRSVSEGSAPPEGAKRAGRRSVSEGSPKPPRRARSGGPARPARKPKPDGQQEARGPTKSGGPPRTDGPPQNNAPPTDGAPPRKRRRRRRRRGPKPGGDSGSGSD